MLPFDLHVLGLPPAFNLSHDQTLRYSKILIELLYSLFFLDVLRQSLDFSSLFPSSFEGPHRLSVLVFKELYFLARRFSAVVLRDNGNIFYSFLFLSQHIFLIFFNFFYILLILKIFITFLLS